MSRNAVRTLAGMPFRFIWPVMVGYESRALVRSGLEAVTMFVWPLSYLLLLGGGISGLMAGGGDTALFRDSLAFIVPGVVAMQANAPFTSMMYRYQGDRQWGLLALKLVQGVSPAAYVAGMSTVPALRFLAQGGVVIAAAAALGVSVGVAPVLYYLLFGLVAALTWACAGGALVFLIRRQATRMSVVQLIGLPLVFGAPIFYSLDTMPAYLRVVAWANPLTYQVELLRGGGTLGLPLVLTVSLGMMVASFALLTVLVARAEPIPAKDAR